MSTTPTNLASFLVLFWVDFVITAFALTTGTARELNPTFANLYLMAAMKAGVTAYAFALAAIMPTLALFTTILKVLSFLYALVVLWNLAQLTL